MAKKKRKDKELAHLRREVEVLRAQLAGQGDTRITRVAGVARETSEREPEVVKKAPAPQPTISTRGEPALDWQSVDPKYIKADLLKSGILTLLALGAIITLTLLL